MARLALALPLLIALAIGGALLWGLGAGRDPSAIPSILISQPVPEFDLPPVPGTGVPGLSAADLGAAGGPVLVNVFASWCVPCRAEHAVLSRMAREDGVRLMGINYKDEPGDALAWLEELGNPYERIGSDLSGRAGIEWGISGVPETFVVDGAGTVVHRQVGPILGSDALAEVERALAAAAGAGT
jgi:cytochrome c biogenesis protein CcmG/thiol:disulfide interchange protein DsbE